MPESLVVRPASREDAHACVAIYRPYVEHTAITFETEPPSAEEMASRIDSAQANHEWLVVEQDGAVIGYAYAHRFNPRPAYQWSVETSIYLATTSHRNGGGRLLYGELLQRLCQRGYRRAFAGIAQPNEPSDHFHRHFGFEPCALYRRVGWKHGTWHDVAWVQVDLAGTADDGGAPGPLL